MDLQVIIENRPFLEGPRWHDGRIRTSDYYGGEVVSAAADGSDLRTELTVDDWPSGSGVLPDGRLVVVSMKEQKILRREPDGRVVVHADLTGLARGPVNDMVVDPQGRCWAGCFGFDVLAGEPVAPAPLLRVDPDGHAEIAADGLHFPNGIVADGRRVVVAETLGNRLSVFDVGADGTLGERRDWARFGDVPDTTVYLEATAQAAVTPDGIAQPDAEGAIWVADAEHHRAIRVAEGGAILEEVTVDEGSQVYAVALGGPDGHTLFLALGPTFGAGVDGAPAGRIAVTRVSVPL